MPPRLDVFTRGVYKYLASSIQLYAHPSFYTTTVSPVLLHNPYLTAYNINISMFLKRVVEGEEFDRTFLFMMCDIPPSVCQMHAEISLFHDNSFTHPFMENKTLYFLPFHFNWNQVYESKRFISFPSNLLYWPIVGGSACNLFFYKMLLKNVETTVNTCLPFR